MTVFKRGDRVKHQTSGKEGIVIEVFQACRNPDHKGPMDCIMKKDGHMVNRGYCKIEPTGMYRVCTDFGEYHTISDVCLELIPSPKEKR